MVRSIGVLVLGTALSLPVVANAQQPNWHQGLQGLMGNNQNENDALHQAYERGYRNGREDELRNMQSRRSMQSENDRYRGQSDSNDQDYEKR